MPEILTPHDESLMPLIMGSPYRVPDYAYLNWGLGNYIDESNADKAYQAEWAAGNAGQLALVSMATELAGFGDYPELLRRTTAIAVSNLVNQMGSSHSLHILDLGAGPGKSAEAVYQALSAEIRGKTELTLLDPSVNSLQTAEELMKRNGIKYRIVPSMDNDMLNQIEPGSVDIITAVASIHHHARIPFETYREVLKPGGFLVIADWHHSLWEHPHRVLEFFKGFQWPNKEKGLQNWIEVYRQAQVTAEPIDNLDDLQAIKQITAFWHRYRQILERKDVKDNNIWPLEGHRPVAIYLENLRSAEFMADSPQQLLPDSSLLMLTVAQKEK